MMITTDKDMGRSGCMGPVGVAGYYGVSGIAGPSGATGPSGGEYATGRAGSYTIDSAGNKVWYTGPTIYVRNPSRTAVFQTAAEYISQKEKEVDAFYRKLHEQEKADRKQSRIKALQSKVWDSSVGRELKGVGEDFKNMYRRLRQWSLQ